MHVEYIYQKIKERRSLLGITQQDLADFFKYALRRHKQKSSIPKILHWKADCSAKNFIRKFTIKKVILVRMILLLSVK